MGNKVSQIDLSAKYVIILLFCLKCALNAVLSSKRELVRAGANNMDVMCWNLMRQIAGGDISNRNLWLAENMLELYVENRTWLDKLPILIASVIFTFLRILEDHFVPQLASLRQKEVGRLV